MIMVIQNCTDRQKGNCDQQYFQTREREVATKLNKKRDGIQYNT